PKYTGCNPDVSPSCKTSFPCADKDVCRVGSSNLLAESTETCDANRLRYMSDFLCQSNNPPSSAAPTALPNVRINIFAAVAIPRVSHPTVLCIATIKDVEVIPIPIPIKKEPAPAQTGPLSGVNIKNNNAPMIKETPPIKEVFR